MTIWLIFCLAKNTEGFSKQNNLNLRKHLFVTRIYLFIKINIFCMTIFLSQFFFAYLKENLPLG